MKNCFRSVSRVYRKMIFQTSGRKICLKTQSIHNLYTIFSFVVRFNSGFRPRKSQWHMSATKRKTMRHWTHVRWDFWVFWHRISKWQRGATRETMGHWKHVKRGSWVFETENLNGTWGQQGQKMGHWKHGLLGFRLRKSNGTRAQQGKQIGFESRHVRWDFGSFGFLNQKIYINGTGVQQGQKMGQWKHVRERDIYI